MFGYRHGEVGIKLSPEDLPDDTFKLKYVNFCDKSRRPMRISLGCHLLGAAEPVPDIKHGPSQLEGTIKRVAKRMPTIDRATLRRLKRSVDKNLKAMFANIQIDVNEIFDFDAWIDQAPYKQSRKDELRKVHDKPFNKKRGYNVKGFTKDESYPQYKMFRGIMSRSDDYKVRVGPFFDILGKLIFGTEHFIKKVPVNLRPDYLMDRIGDAVDTMFTDYSSFESWFVKIIMKIERRIYLYFLKGNPRKDEIMKFIDKGILLVYDCSPI